MKPSNRILRNSEILSKTFDEEFVLYDTRHDLVHFLNETAAFIWKLCDGTRREGEILSEMIERFDVSREVLERDVHTILERFREQELITAANQGTE